MATFMPSDPLGGFLHLGAPLWAESFNCDRPTQTGQCSATGAMNVELSAIPTKAENLSALLSEANGEFGLSSGVAVANYDFTGM